MEAEGAQRLATELVVVKEGVCGLRLNTVDEATTPWVT